MDNPTLSGFTMQMYLTLNAGIASGARSVYYGDKRVEYRSLEEMLSVRRLMMLELGLIQPASGRRFAAFSDAIHCGTPGSGTLEGGSTNYNFDTESKWL